jgi:hypothetical protein
MDYLFEGSIKSIDETQTFKGDFKKREFVVTTNDTYPQEVKFEMVNDTVDFLDGFNIGDNVKVAFLVRGNAYNGKHYVNLRAIAVGLIDEEGKTAKPKAATASKTKTVVTQIQEDDDDLPF